MARNHHAQPTRHVIHVGKRITQRKNVGKALANIYGPKGPETMKKPMMTQMMKQNPKSQIIMIFRQYIKDTNGTPSLVWPQQMEKAYIKTYKEVHNDRPDRYNDFDYTKEFETQFRPLQLIEEYTTQYIDPEYGKDPYLDDELYDKQNLQFRRDDHPPTDDEDDPKILDNNLSWALIDLWQPNLEATFQEVEELYRQEDHQDPSSLLDETTFIHLLVEKEGEPSYVPLSTNRGLKFKRRILYFPMDFGELTLDGLKDTGAHSSAIPEADPRKIRVLAPQSILKEGPAPSFQILVANGDLETRSLKSET